MSLSVPVRSNRWLFGALPCRFQRVVAIALSLLLAVPISGWGQDEEADKNKVSNDDPARPLQMPPASTEVREAFADFDRFQRRQAWERAFKALESIPADQASRFVDGEDGFIISVARKQRTVLSNLSAEGKAAYRLYHDAEAQKLFDESKGPKELETLEKLFAAEFLSSVGDDASDRLADLYFEQGRFDRAADCWLAILEQHPDTNLSPVMLSCKAAIALFRAGRLKEYQTQKEEIVRRFSGETVTVAGKTMAPTDLLASFGGAAEGAGATSSTEDAELQSLPSSEREPDWQFRFADAIEAGMSPPEVDQWRKNTLSQSFPATVIHGTKLYANYLGYYFCLDLETGKLLWRSESFQPLATVARQGYARYADTERYGIIAQGDRIWVLSRKLSDNNYRAQFQLACHRADNGDPIWSTQNLSDYATFDLTGNLLLADGKLFISGKTQSGQSEQWVLAIQPEDGRLLWKTLIGKSRQGQQYYYYYSPQKEDAPRLLYRQGTLYVNTQAGILAQMDADSGELRWGFGYPSDASTSSSRFIFFFDEYPTVQSTGSVSDLLQSQGMLLVKGSSSNRLSAVEPNQMKRSWDRPVSKDARLLAVGERTLYFGGDELSAMDLRTRELLWATRLPGGSKKGKVLLSATGIWQLTSRGVFELDPQTGRVRTIFRGSDLGSDAGDLLIDDKRLFCVSNRCITAYSRRAADAVTAARESSTEKATNE